MQKNKRYVVELTVVGNDTFEVETVHNERWVNQHKVDFKPVDKRDFARVLRHARLVTT